jgi:hypothetical protein
VKGERGEGLQAGRVVSGHVFDSWDVGSGVVVPVEALVVALDVAEESCCTEGGDCTFVDTRDSGGVVAEGFDGGVFEAAALGHDIGLGQNGRVFQVAVGDAAMGVGRGDQIGLDVSREGVSPVVALAGVVEEDATHASPSCIGGANEGGRLGDELGDVGGARAKAGCQSTEGGQAGMNEGVEPDPVVAGLVLSPLQGAEEASGARDGKRDKPELPKNTAPAFGADTAEALEAGKDVVEQLFAVRRKLDGLSDRVDNPPKDEFASTPASIAREELFERNRFVSPVSWFGPR